MIARNPGGSAGFCADKRDGAMRLFLLTFLFLYGALHYYILVKARAAFSLGVFPTFIVAFFLLVMVLAPLIIYNAEKHGYESFAHVSAYVGYIWMGMAFLFFTSSILIDGYRLLLSAGGLILKREFSPPLPLWRFLVPFLFALIAGTYGYFEARNIRTERVVLKTPKISREVGRLKIVQITDVHLGIIVRGDRLARILSEVKKASPDILISTGDLVDGQMTRLNNLSQLLEEIQPKFGKFAITGNHEFYAGLPQALEFTRRGGFSILRGESLTVAGEINLAGVDNVTALSYGLREIPEKELLSRLPRDKFTVFLKHQPVLEETSLGLFDLQISGHTHQGQIFPFRMLTRIFFPFDGGLFQLPQGAVLYVSRGSGTWGPPIRFLTPPEVTIFELVHEEKPPEQGSSVPGVTGPSQKNKNP